MDWVEFVQQNRTMLDLKFMWSKPKHYRSDWPGHYTRHINLWMNFDQSRLYIPISMLSDAGYIDLYNKSYEIITDRDGAEAILKEVLEYLREHAG